MELTTNGKKLYESVRLSNKLLQKINIIVEKDKIHLIGMDLSKAFLYRCSQECSSKEEWSGALMADKLLALLKGCGKETTLLLDNVITVVKGNRKSSYPVEDVDKDMYAHIHREFKASTELHIESELIKGFLSEVTSLTTDTGLSVLFTGKDNVLTLSVNENGVQTTEVFEGITGDAVSRYGLNYLVSVFDKGEVVLKFGDEAPLIVVDGDTIFVIAPRVENN